MSSAGDITYIDDLAAWAGATNAATNPMVTAVQTAGGPAADALAHYPTLIEILGVSHGMPVRLLNPELGRALRGI